MTTANRCSNPNCEYLNRTLPNTAKVCPLCGTPLGNVVPATRLLNHQAPEVVKQPAVLAPSTPPSQARPTLKLIHTSGREFCLPGEDGNIGRRTHTNKTLPEIDLTGIPNEGIVSRSHARIYWNQSQGAYTLADNNSRNGTYLNGYLLSPNVQYQLNHNDSLQLGQDHLVCFTVVLI